MIIREILNDYIVDPNNKFLIVTIAIIMADIALGMICALYNKNFKSNIARKGLTNHLTIIILIIISFPILEMFRIDRVLTLANTVLVYYMLAYGVSIIENLSKMGVPFPPKIKKMLVDDFNDMNVISTDSKSLSDSSKESESVISNISDILKGK